MKIDIITYTEEQFAKLTDEQLLEVQSAQIKKNDLKYKMEKGLAKEKKRLIENGIFLSEMWSLILKKWQTWYNTEVENVRDGLLFYLQYSNKPSDSAQESAPYEVDYSLPMDERYYLVLDYYEATYTDPEKRLEAFKADEVAVQYLGEYYKTLYDYFLEDV